MFQNHGVPQKIRTFAIVNTKYLKYFIFFGSVISFVHLRQMVILTVAWGTF